jgi:protocatechuate 3,4-dioxygenase beta subunit
MPATSVATPKIHRNPARETRATARGSQPAPTTTRIQQPVTPARQPVSAEVAALLDDCTTTCQLFAEQDEGPYRRGEQPHRRDIVDGRAGSPLVLGLRLGTATGDAVVAAEVEIWHCDAQGRYSGYPPNDPSVAVDSAPQRGEYLPSERFLRGRQTTDDAGRVEFRTIYPGWYPGRTVHIHLMVHTAAGTHTSQLYLPEDLSADVFAHGPYQSHGVPDTTHATDGIFATGGDPALLDVRPMGGGHAAVLCLALPDAEVG